MTLPPRSGRRLATAFVSVAIAAILASGTVLAGTPVTNGYRDHTYAGGAFRPTADKGQSKLWYTADGQWWAGMFRYTASPAVSENRIWKLSSDKTAWLLTATVVDTRDPAHADYLWDEASDTLYVASVSPIPDTTPTTVIGDGIRIFKYGYSAGVYTLAGTYPKTVPGTNSGAGSSGGAATVTIAKDSTGDLWVVWPKNGQVRYSRSADDGATWSTPAQVPTQVGNSIKQSPIDNDNDTAVVVAFGAGSPNKIGVAWSDHDEQPTLGGNGYYFTAIDAGAVPTVAANWSAAQLLPTTLTSGLGERADNHINIKATSDGSLYMVGKTGADTADCATNKQKSLIEVFERTPGGTWSAHLAGTVGDCNTRAQILISEQLDAAYLFLTSPNGGGAVYRKSAPLNGTDAFDFRGAADLTVQRGTPFIRSATETLIDDASTTKQVVTSASGIAVIANNVRSVTQTTGKFFFHNVMSLPSNDATPPSGSVSINGGGASTGNPVVSVAVPASDTGSGVSVVRLSNASDMSGSTTFAYTTPIAWRLTAGLGVKTVYVQWRDAAGNWSATSSDSITVTDDATAPTTPGIPTQSICCSSATAFPVRLTWTASTDNVAVHHYEVWQSVNGGTYTKVAEPTTNSVSRALSHASKTYRYAVRAVDATGNRSAFRYGPTFRTISYSESSSAVSFSSGWGLSSSTAFVGGKAKYSVRAGRSASLTFIGNRVAWMSATGPNMGSARVYINGTLTSTVNLFSTTPVARKLVFGRTYSTTATRTIRIVVVGTAGHPRVVVDQIYVLR